MRDYQVSRPIRNLKVTIFETVDQSLTMNDKQSLSDIYHENLDSLILNVM